MSINKIRPTSPSRETESLLTGDSAIDELDLGPIKVKMKEENVGKENWTYEELEKVEDQYRAFLALHKRHPDKALVPTKLIDGFWHQHMLDSRKYFEDCDNCFGQYLHHFPYFGMRGDEDKQNLISSANETAELFASEFPNLESPYTTISEGAVCMTGDDISAASCRIVDCTQCRISLCN